MWCRPVNMYDDGLCLSVQLRNRSFKINHFRCAPENALSKVEDHKLILQFLLYLHSWFHIEYAGSGRKFWVKECVIKGRRSLSIDHGLYVAIMSYFPCFILAANVVS